MARPKQNKNLAAQVQVIIADAMDRVKSLVEDSLSSQLGGMLGVSGKGGAKRGRPAGGGKKAAGKGRGKKGGAGKGRPGRKPTVGPERVDALVALVSKQGEVVPKDARKVLKITAAQMQAAARAAADQKLIKVKGAGRGTRYVKA